MRLDDIKLLFAYDNWATERLLAACARLDAVPQELLAKLAHICEAQRAWRFMLTQGSFSDFVRPHEFAELGSLRELCQRENAALSRYIDGLTDSDMTREFQYVGDAGARKRMVWHVLWHVVNHGAQHRAECAVILTDLGQSPGDLDFPIFLDKPARG